MARFILHWLVTAVALGIAARIVPGVQIASGGVLVGAALVLGFVNAIVRPILVILTLPLTLLTLGLFYLVVNGMAFGIAAAIVPGFAVASLGSAVVGALVVAVISSLISWLMRASQPRDG
jgi:putative membrane protein